MKRFLSDFRLLTASERSMWRYKVMWLSVLAIVLVPVLYATIYLGSVWDPYGRLNDLPAALVDEDRGTTARGQHYDLGAELRARLLKDPPAKFTVYRTRALAEAAVRRGDVYFALSIPADFSARALGGSSSEHGLLNLYTADGTSYFAGRVAGALADRLADELNGQLGSARWQVVQRSLAQGQAQLRQLRAAAVQLRDGAGTLEGGGARLARGAGQLGAGLQQARSGADQLQSGAASLSGGVTRLTGGTAKLSAAARQLEAAAPGQAQLEPLQQGAARVQDGAARLKMGAAALAQGSERLSGGTRTANAGAAQVSAGAVQLAGQLPALATGASNLQNGAERLATGATALQAGAVQVQQGAGQLASSTGTLPPVHEGVQALQVGIDRLTTGAGDIQGGAAALQQGAAREAAGAQTTVNGARALASGARGVQAGAAQLPGGAATLAASSAQAASGAATLATGAAVLRSGVDQLAQGNLRLNAALKQLGGQLPAASQLSALDSGAASVARGSRELASGLAPLTTGAASVQDGARQLQQGAGKLREGLNTLAARIPGSLGSVGGDPAGLAVSVQVSRQSAAAVPSNGAAFAPYFMALSLWVGVTLTTFVFPYLQLPESGRQTTRLARVLRKAALPAGVVLAQAVIVVLGVHLLGVPYLHPWAVLGTALLASLTFLALVQALLVLLGDAGRILSLILLVVQLAASGGSYPAELAPPAFQRLHALLPVTDAVSALRAALFGSYDGHSGPYLLRLALVLALSLTVSVLLGRRQWRFVQDGEFRPLVYVGSRE